MWMNDFTSNDAKTKTRKKKISKATTDSTSLDEANTMLRGVKKSVVDNIGKALRRVDDLEHVAKRTEDLYDKTKDFNYNGRQLRDSMWQQRMKTNLIMGGLSIGFIYCTSAWICGGMYLPICMEYL